MTPILKKGYLVSYSKRMDSQLESEVKSRIETLLITLNDNVALEHSYDGYEAAIKDLRELQLFINSDMMKQEDLIYKTYLELVDHALYLSDVRNFLLRYLDLMRTKTDLRMKELERLASMRWIIAANIARAINKLGVPEIHFREFCLLNPGEIYSYYRGIAIYKPKVPLLEKLKYELEDYFNVYEMISKIKNKRRDIKKEFDQIVLEYHKDLQVINQFAKKKQELDNKIIIQQMRERIILRLEGQYYRHTEMLLRGKTLVDDILGEERGRIVSKSMKIYSQIKNYLDQDMIPLNDDFLEAFRRYIGGEIVNKQKENVVMNTNSYSVYIKGNEETKQFLLGYFLAFYLVGAIKWIEKLNKNKSNVYIIGIETNNTTPEGEEFQFTNARTQIKTFNFYSNGTVIYEKIQYACKD